MMDVITGKTWGDDGSAFFGQTIDLTRLSDPAIADRGIGRKFRKPTVFTDHTVFEESRARAQGGQARVAHARGEARLGGARPHPRHPRHDQAGPPRRGARPGKVEFDTKTITTLPACARASLGLVYAPLGRDIFPRLAVRENMAEGIQLSIPQDIFAV